MELLKLLSSNEIVVQILSFLLLLFLMRKFFWNKLLSVLDKRKQGIADELKMIEDAKSGVQSLKSEYESKLGSIEDISAKKIQEAVAEGRRLTEEIRKKAHEQAQDIIENARDNIKHELIKAKEELKDKIIDLTINAAENIIREKITEEDDRKLVKDFLDRIDEAE